MERRRNRRSKRRIFCEFQHEGHSYRGIAVNLSPSGLFIHTNASLSAGAKLEVAFLGDPFGKVSLRGVVVRRRAPLHALAAVIRPGLGLRIIEAPDAYFEVLGEEESPAPAASTAPPESPAEAAMLSEADLTEPETSMPRGSERTPEDEEAWPPKALHRSEALLIDDGELDDVYAMLEALGADPLRQQEAADADFRDWENPPRAVVVSARAATRLTVATRASESSMVTIAVAEADSQTLCEMLRRQGFDYVVRRPVHPQALRLLLMRALFRGSEHRSEPRLPIGCEVTARWAIRRRSATLLEISGSGCSFLGREEVKPGSRISVHIPPWVSGGRELTLRGRVRRSEHRRGAEPEASALVVLGFDPLSRRTRERLERLLAACLTGPPALPRATQQSSRDAKQSAPGSDAGDLTDATRRVPRRHPRATFDREVVVLDEQLQQARQVLFARDLSVEGVRVEPHPDLQLGDRFKLALYHDASSDSVVVDAEVLRDEGTRGLALGFPHTPARTARKIRRILKHTGEIERCDAPGDAHQVIVTKWIQAEPT